MRLRLAIFCLFALCFQVLAGQSVLDQRLDFSVQEASISETLLRLSEVSGVDIAFSSRFFAGEEKLSLDFEDVDLGFLLRHLLEGTDITFKTTESSILLFRERPKTVTLSGYVRERKSGEGLVAATVYCPDLKLGTNANEYGFYSLTLPLGVHTIMVRRVGYSHEVFELNFREDAHYDASLYPNIELRSVIISPKAHLATVEASQGVTLTTALVRNTPSLSGHEDYVRAAHLLPGVDGGVDGLGGLYVRGGDAGQNLMLLDGAPVFIPFHLLGAYSIYNAKTVKSAHLVKGRFSARYGGRLSSVFDVRTREGDMENWHGGVSLDLSQLQVNIEGPFRKERGSVLVSGRYSPSAFLLSPVFKRTYFQDTEGKVETDFYDLNVKANYIFGKKDRLFLSFFRGGDKFEGEYDLKNEEESRESETELLWGNTAASLRWNHLFSDKLFANTTFTYSRFSFSYFAYDQFSPTDTTVLQSLFFLDSRSENTHTELRTDFDYHFSPRHKFRYGAGIAAPNFKPAFTYLDHESSELTALDSVSSADLKSLIEKKEEQVGQAHAYFEDQMMISEHVKLNLGLRATLFAADDHVYVRPEPRLNLQFEPHDKLQFFAAGSRMVQYLHLVANTASRFPNDIWITSSEDIRPQESWLAEAGVSYHPHQTLTLTLETYYKAMNNLYSLSDSLNYLQAADLSKPKDFLIPGQGTAYGSEFMLTYDKDSHHFMASYTLSKSTRQFDAINLGIPFAHAFDRRHQFKVFASPYLGKRFRLGLNWVFLSGNPRFDAVVVASGIGLVNDLRYAPGEKNRIRSRPYHRLDVNLSYRFETGSVAHRLKVGVFNAYGQRNAVHYRTNAAGPQPVYSIPFTPSAFYSIEF